MKTAQSYFQVVPESKKTRVILSKYQNCDLYSSSTAQIYKRVNRHDGAAKDELSRRQQLTDSEWSAAVSIDL